MANSTNSANDESLEASEESRLTDAAQAPEDMMNTMNNTEDTGASLQEEKSTFDGEEESVDSPEPTISQLQEEVEVLFSSLQRKAADLENLKKRHQKQVADERLYGQSKILKDFADVFDDFHRALEHAGEAGDNGDLMKGVQLVHDKFDSVLQRYGVQSFGSVGERFDPNIHEALHRQEDESVPRNTVLQVFQRGYRLNDRVLRPAGVVVSAGGPEA